MSRPDLREIVEVTVRNRSGRRSYRPGVVDRIMRNVRARLGAVLEWETTSPALVGERTRMVLDALADEFRREESEAFDGRS